MASYVRTQTSAVNSLDPERVELLSMPGEDELHPAGAPCYHGRQVVKPAALCLAPLQTSLRAAFLSGRAAGPSCQCGRSNLPWVSMTVRLLCFTLAGSLLDVCTLCTALLMSE